MRQSTRANGLLAAPIGSWRKIRPLAGSSRRLLPIATASWLISGTCEAFLLVLVSALANGLILDQHDVEIIGRHLSIRGAIIAAFVFLAGRTIFVGITASASSRLAGAVVQRLRTVQLSNYLWSNYTNRGRKPLGTTQFEIATQAEKVGDLTTSLATMWGNILTLISFVGTAIVVHAPTAIAIAISGALLINVLRPVTRRTRATAQTMLEATKQLSNDVTEAETLSLEIETFGAVDSFAERVGATIHLATDRYRRARFYINAVPQFFQSAGLGVVVTAIGLMALVRPGEAIGAIGATILLLVRALSAAQAVVNANQRITELAPQVDSAVEATEQDAAALRRTGSSHVADPLPLTLEEICYRYPGGDADQRNALSHINLTIGAGESLGIIGPSGSGKSTLTLLLLGVLEATSGRIEISGQPFGHNTAVMDTSATAFVPQQPRLLRGTLRENVAFTRPADDQRIFELLDQLGLVDELGPDLLDLRLEPGSGDLSGGQRQRLAIARALLTRPRLLILDEPTSALDPVSEERVQVVLDETKASSAMVIVAHRMSTVMACDRIAAMEAGEIRVIGPPSELAEKSEYFQNALRAMQRSHDHGS